MTDLKENQLSLVKRFLQMPSAVVTMRLGSILLFLAALAWQNLLHRQKAITLGWNVPITLLVFTATTVAFLVFGLEKKEQEPGETLALKKGLGLYSWAGFFLMAVVGFVLAWQLATLYWRIPVTPFLADMLPLIRQCLRDFWRDGQYPYHYHHTGSWDIPMTYMPGLWLAYSPAFLLKFDLRLISAFSALASAFLVMSHSWGVLRNRPRNWWLLIPAAAIGIWLFTVPPFPDFQRISHTSPFWLILVLWAVCAKEKFWLSSAFFYGWALCARPTMIITLPIWCIFLFKNRRNLPLINMLLVWGLSGLLWGFFFFLKSPRDFNAGILGWYEEGSLLNIKRDPQLLLLIGFTGMLEKVGLFAWKLYVAAGLAGLVTLWAIKKVKNANQMVAFSCVAMLFFLGCSVIPWFYIYFPPLLALAVAAWPDPPPDGSCKSRFLAFQPAGRVWIPLGLAFLATLLAGLGTFQDGRKSSTAGKLMAHQVPAGENILVGFGENWTEGKKIVSTECNFAIPETRVTARTLRLDFLATDSPLKAPWRVFVFLNGEALGSAVINPDSLPGAFSFSVPRGNLLRGLNLVHLSFRQPAEEAAFGVKPSSGLEGIALKQAALTDPRPVRFWPTPYWQLKNAQAQ